MNKFTLHRSTRHRSSARTSLPRSPWAPAAMAGAITLTALATVTAPWSAVAAEPPIGLGTAGAYSVLGGQTVTNTGPTGLSAGLGVSPGTAIVGFPPGVALGPVNAGNAAALQAQSDLTVAYNDAAGRALTESVAGDLVGRTLVPGVYNSSGPLALSGNLTLDAQNDPNAVFIFQVASELVTASGSSVTLVNGARACNVYWQIGSSATLGTASAFKGTVLALTSITVTTAASVEGRALARNGAVTLDNNSFITNSCAAVASPVPTATPTGTPTATPSPTTPVPQPTESLPAPVPTETIPAPVPTPTITSPVPQPTESLPAPVPTPTITSPVPQPTETIPAPVPTPTITTPATPTPTPTPTITVPATPTPSITVPATPTPTPTPQGDGGTGDSGYGLGNEGDSGAPDSSPDEVPTGTNRGTNIQTAVSAPAESGPSASMLYLGAAAACLVVAGVTSRRPRTTRRH